MRVTFGAAMPVARPVQFGARPTAVVTLAEESTRKLLQPQTNICANDMGFVPDEAGELHITDNSSRDDWQNRLHPKPSYDFMISQSGMARNRSEWGSVKQYNLTKTSNNSLVLASVVEIFPVKHVPRKFRSMQPFKTDGGYHFVERQATDADRRQLESLIEANVKA